MQTSALSANYRMPYPRDLIAEIQTLLLERLSIRVESAEVDLFQTGVLDSVTLVRLLFHIEERFGVEVPIQDLGLVCSVARIAELVANHKWSPHPAIAGEREMVTEVQALFLEKLSIPVEFVEADLFARGVLDSMRLVQLILGLEERFGVQLPMEDLEVDSFASVVKIADLVASRRRVEVIGEDKVA